MLQEAKSKCDYLVVGLLIDPTVDRPDSKNKPIQTPFERYVQLSSCRYVDEVIPFTTEQEIVDMILKTPKQDSEKAKVEKTAGSFKVIKFLHLSPNFLAIKYE